MLIAIYILILVASVACLYFAHRSKKDALEMYDKSLGILDDARRLREETMQDIENIMRLTN